MKNILFLSLCSYKTITESDIYTDLLRVFTKHGHHVVIASPLEKKYHKKPRTIIENNSEIVEVLINDYFNVGSIKKGVSLLSIDRRFKNSLKHKYHGFHFDLVLYATPPIMFIKTISYFKRLGAQTYLMLKDIFPQNAVDLCMMKKSGIKGLVYKYFRSKEKKIYSLSNKIGCMSPANVQYLLLNNNQIDRSKVEVCPNCLDSLAVKIENSEKAAIRKKYGLPLSTKVFVYGGNLGKPQDISFIIKCLVAVKNRHDCFFVIAGDGTEFKKLDDYKNESKQNNFVLLKRLERDEFDKLLLSCDIGLIFLDYRFTIPNFPSRLLSYMRARLPVLACTDEVTDVGKIITNNEFGWWCKSNSQNEFCSAVDAALADDHKKKGENGYRFFEENYSSSIVASIVEKSVGIKNE